MIFSTCRSDNVLRTRNILITRGQIDDLLTDQYLSYAHIDAFAHLTIKENKISPSLFVQYVYISCLHWVSLTQHYLHFFMLIT